MTIRTSKKTVTFKWPFNLAGFDRELPAGAYNVETDEELLEGISFPVYRRIATLIHLHAQAGKPGLTQILTIDPTELDAARRRDEAPADTQADQKTLNGTTEAGVNAADLQAIERAEDEGMLVHSR
jgi:hypothetical protein